MVKTPHRQPEPGDHSKIPNVSKIIKLKPYIGVDLNGELLSILKLDLKPVKRKR